jgi:hypothetical protein
MTTLTNSFHGTSIRIRAFLSWEQIEDAAYHALRCMPYQRTAGDRRAIALHRRIKATLCGSSTCHCGVVR